ncbi:MAG TPA: anhydro-N-acetylmuramic acid kinase [Burkholderiales bacterium]|nr:anhydro-N-acetylmuramic acid kinase [Burkholderiales bacterium]
MKTPAFFVGIMSGTSLDGVDAVLADFSATPWQLRHHVYQPYTRALREQMLSLQRPAENELHYAMCAANDLAHCYAAAVNEMLTQTRINAEQVIAIGCHGQTVRHNPQQGYSLQLCNAALLTELCGISVISDFRSRDIAAGGNGAPLVPAFHRALFPDRNVHRVIVNIGGISNLTNLPRQGKYFGFDCGPGNVLLDSWCESQTGQRFDANGAWAASGKIIPYLLKRLRAHPFFSQAPPKSCGREQFNVQWLNGLLSGKEAPHDVQATLLELTVQSIVQAVAEYCRGAEEIYLCGGGARNQVLVKTLSKALPGIKTDVTDALGVNPQTLEAYAFAWLAWQTIQGKPGNLPQTTGARGERVLGAIYKK